MTTYVKTYKKFNRVPFHYYATPPEAIKALLDGDIWEPSYGVEIHLFREDLSDNNQ